MILDTSKSTWLATATRGGHVSVEHTFPTKTWFLCYFGYEHIRQVLATATQGGHVGVEHTYLQ